MNINDCINFANENKICFLATADNGQPRVRVMGFWFADQTGFYFQASTGRELYQQIVNNPKTETCFYKPDDDLGTVLRVAGNAQIIDDRGLKEKALEDRPFLKSAGFTPDSKELVIFKIQHGEAHFWNKDSKDAQKNVIKF